MTVPSTGRLLLEQRCRTREGTPQWGIRTSRLLSGHAHLQHRGPRRDGTSRTSHEGQRKNEPAPPGRPQSGTDAKKAEADLKIALALRSSRTSFSSSASRSASLVVVPGRWPSSISACTTQFLSVSGLIPSCSPTRRNVPDLVAGSSRASTAILVALSRSSSGYFLGAAMLLILPWIQSLHQTRGDSGCGQ